VPLFDMTTWIAASCRLHEIIVFENEEECEATVDSIMHYLYTLRIARPHQHDL